jgi:hypothetical protein
MSSHLIDVTRRLSLAEELGIHIEFIPAGMTAECQPLDRRLFGNLKSRARCRFDYMWMARNGDPTMQESILMLLAAWKSITQDEVLDAWERAEQ